MADAISVVIGVIFGATYLTLAALFVRWLWRRRGPIASILGVAVSFALSIAVPLGGLYLLVRFVKWAWTD